MIKKRRFHKENKASEIKLRVINGSSKADKTYQEWQRIQGQTQLLTDMLRRTHEWLPRLALENPDLNAVEFYKGLKQAKEASFGKLFEYEKKIPGRLFGEDIERIQFGSVTPPDISRLLPLEQLLRMLSSIGKFQPVQPFFPQEEEEENPNVFEGQVRFADAVQYNFGPDNDSSDATRIIRPRRHFYNDGLDFNVWLNAKGPWYDLLGWEDADSMATSVLLGYEFPIPRVDSWLYFAADYYLQGVNHYSDAEASLGFIEEVSRLQFDDLDAPNILYGSFFEEPIPSTDEGHPWLNSSSYSYSFEHADPHHILPDIEVRSQQMPQWIRVNAGVRAKLWFGFSLVLRAIDGIIQMYTPYWDREVLDPTIGSPGVFIKGRHPDYRSAGFYYKIVPLDYWD